MNTLTIATWLERKIGPGGMKQAAVAREIGVGQSMVSRWRRGEAVPSPENCRRLARLFGEPETVVLAMAGHLSAADSPRPERSLVDLARELLARLQEDGRLGTNGSIADRPLSGSMAGIYQRPHVARASVASPAAVLSRLARWGTTMADAEYEHWVIQGDWLLPAVAAGTEIRVSPPGGAKPGSHVIVTDGDRMCTGHILAGGEQVAIDGHGTMPIDSLTVVAVIRARVIEEPEHH